MRAIVVLTFLITFVASASDEADSYTCGILNSEVPAVLLNAYGYGELREGNEIQANEALIWEYSSEPYCETSEYLDKLEDSYDRELAKIDSKSDSLGAVIRNGFKDNCHYRAIVSIENSPFKFLSKFKRRIHTMKSNGEHVTWFIHENKKGIKFTHRHPNETIRECVENGI